MLIGKEFPFSLHFVVKVFRLELINQKLSCDSNSKEGMKNAKVFFSFSLFPTLCAAAGRVEKLVRDRLKSSCRYQFPFAIFIWVFFLL